MESWKDLGENFKMCFQSAIGKQVMHEKYVMYMGEVLFELYTFGGSQNSLESPWKMIEWIYEKEHDEKIKWNAIFYNVLFCFLGFQMWPWVNALVIMQFMWWVWNYRNLKAAAAAGVVPSKSQTGFLWSPAGKTMYCDSRVGILGNTGAGFLRFGQQLYSNNLPSVNAEEQRLAGSSSFMGKVWAARCVHDSVTARSLLAYIIDHGTQIDWKIDNLSFRLTSACRQRTWQQLYHYACLTHPRVRSCLTSVRSATQDSCFWPRAESFHIFLTNTNCCCYCTWAILICHLP